MIEGVKITKLAKFCDERGIIMHMLKRTDPSFTEFGEIYFSCGYPGVVKAWHIHKEMTLNDCCLVGMIKLVIYDLRPDSSTHGELMELFIGEQNYCVVQIPPGVANGYKAYGDKMAIVANCASMPHDKSELIYIDPFHNDIPYDWSLKHG
jgi:dTDP-4-dehydrorhamnose 3,5-epimerase